MVNELKDLEIRSEEVQEILTRIPHWMVRWGSLLFLFIFLMVLAFSWFIKYPDIIKGKATITTKITPQKIYSQNNGKLDTILIKNNQLVKRNSKLAIIENSANFEDVFLLKSILANIKIDKMKFIFPNDSISPLFLGDIESSYALFENNYIQYNLDKMLKPFSNEVMAEKFALIEQNNRLKNLKLQHVIFKSEQSLQQKDLDRSKLLFDKGVISAMEFENKQMEYLQSERKFKNLGIEISQLLETINFSKRNSKGNRIMKVKEDMSLFKNVVHSFDQLKKSIKDWEKLYVINSDITGYASFSNYWTENQIVSKDELIFTIIPKNNKHYVVRLLAPSHNSGKIKKNQIVKITLDNFPETEFGALSGVVKSISTLPNTDGFYRVEVDLPRKLITTYNKEIIFKHEMGGTAEIITEDLRLLERFFYQIIQSVKT